MGWHFLTDSKMYLNLLSLSLMGWRICSQKHFHSHYLRLNRWLSLNLMDLRSCFHSLNLTLMDSRSCYHLLSLSLKDLLIYFR